MGAFVTRRLLSGVLLVLLLTFMSYVVFELIPVNPGCLRVPCGPGTSSTDADINAAKHELGVDRPLVYQYARFLWRFVRHGSLGQSWIDQGSVNHAIAQALPATASIVGGGIVLLLLLAVPLGCVAALRPRSAADRGILAFSVAGIAVHPFVVAIVLRDAVGGKTGIPNRGYCPLSGGQACGGAVDWTTHLVLPWACFALFFLPIYLRMIRLRLHDTLGEQFVVTARAKGASERRVITRHVVRNAVGPLLPMLAADAGTALTAAIYIEVIFGIPGLGRLAVHALAGEAGGYDRPLVVGIVATVGLFVVLLNVASDIAGAWLDPRVRSRAPRAFLRLPLPRFAARVPRPAAAAVALALVAAAAVLVYTSGSSPSAVRLDGPVRSQQLSWHEEHLLDGGSATDDVVVAVDSLELGASGWRVHASVTNAAAEPVSIRPGGARQGTFSLVYEDGQDRRVLAAFAFTPPLPATLGPGRSWTGSFGGVEQVPAHHPYHVGFGSFALVDGGTPTWVLTYETELTP